MSLNVERVALGSEASESAYRDFCERCPQVVAQQTLEWCYAIKDLGPDEPFLLMAKEGEAVVGILPAYLYRHPLGNIITSVPQPGPLGGVTADPKYPNRKLVYKALLGAMEEVARDEGCTTMTVITSPFVDDRGLYEGCGPWEFTLENFCQILLLEKFFESDGTICWKSLSGDTNRARHRKGNINRNLARAKRSVTVRETDDEALLESWWNIHRERHKFIGATPLPKVLFEQIRHWMLLGNKGFFLGAFIGDALVGGSWYLHHGTTVDVFMLSANEAGLAQGANYFLTYASLQRAHELGAHWYNWQSSPSRTSGVYGFKAQWGSEDRTYAFLTRVVGDMSAIYESTEAEIREAYRWHYVLPFSVLSEKKVKHVIKDDFGTVDLASRTGKAK